MEAKMNIIGGILRRINSNCNLDNFKGRLIFQKTVYFMQVFGLNFGYNFNWYVYGPYSPDLTKDAFGDTMIFKKEIGFVNPNFENNLENLKKFLGDKVNDDHWLELIASLHFLKKIFPSQNKDEIIGKVINKQTHFNKEECNNVWKYLEKFKLI